MSKTEDVVRRAFGAENRRRLIDRYFAENGDPTFTDAWAHVYRLLLWADRTTGLAHCYESDKSQPGRHWYERSLRFHDWLSQQFGVSPAELTDHLDWLFRTALVDIAAGVTDARSAAAAAEQRRPYEGRGFPEPDEDPDLEYIVLDALGPWLHDRPPPTALRDLSRRVHTYLAQENKRKNMLGEGFEDVLAAVLSRLSIPGVKTVRTRPALHELGGFYEPRGRDKARKVDLALLTGDRRVLVTAKWSVRADREEQFLTDFEAYARLESSGMPFEYYWLTNEFDAARLVASSDKMVGNSPLFSAIVHIAPDGVLAAYGDRLARSQRRIPALIEEGRLVGLGDWLRSLKT